MPSDEIIRVKMRAEKTLKHYPDLFDDLKTPQKYAFLAWLPDNYHVVLAFGRAAHELKTRGNRERYSCYTIREKLRWDSLLSENGTEFKLSNDNTPFLARLIMKMSPRLDGMFVIKGSK